MWSALSSSLILLLSVQGRVVSPSSFCLPPAYQLWASSSILFLGCVGHTMALWWCFHFPFSCRDWLLCLTCGCQKGMVKNFLATALYVHVVFPCCLACVVRFECVFVCVYATSMCVWIILSSRFMVWALHGSLPCPSWCSNVCAWGGENSACAYSAGRQDSLIYTFLAFKTCVYSFLSYFFLPVAPVLRLCLGIYQGMFSIFYSLLIL